MNGALKDITKKAFLWMLRISLYQIANGKILSL